MAKGKKVYLNVENLSVIKESLRYSLRDIEKGSDSYEGKQKTIASIKRAQEKLRK